MAEFQIKSGKEIFKAGTKLSFLAHIVEGRVKMHLPSTELELTAGDVIGLIDIDTHIHSCDYIALEDTVLETFPCSKSTDLTKLITSSHSSALIFEGFERQMQTLLDTYTLMRYDCSTMFSYLHNSYADYCKFCTEAIITPKELPGLNDFPRLVLDIVIDNWKLQYYKDFKEIFEKPDLTQINAHPDFYLGLLHMGCQDIFALLNSFQIMSDYMHEMSYFLINEDSTDFLDLYTTLLISMVKDGNDTTNILAALSKLMLHIESIHTIDSDLLEKRRNDYNALLNKLEQLSTLAADRAYQKQMAQTTDLLHNSIDVILDYAGYDDDKAFTVKLALKDYKQLPDKSSTSEDATAIREHLTNIFYELYKTVFICTLTATEIPPIVWMFLHFGYMDEELAGMDNATYLYSLAGNFHGSDELHIYTFYEWLLKIYNGEKEPRRNEFDTDYSTHIQEMFTSGIINAEQKELMLNDPVQKILFELNNLFPVANRLTYGRITTFCPAFSEHNVSKTLDDCLLTADKISSLLASIIKVDYSAFYRQTLYTNQDYGITREFIQKEILPDIILMPNVGIRGSVWQEIEGKNRTTPATFLLPIFSLENPQIILTRMVGEFRWEMCKRIQGSKWNDVTEHSLTSDYFDYLQFYRKNNELSPETKEKCTNQLRKCKNNFKEFFIVDYICWVLYESTGSPRLNRYARTILATYCPFSKNIRDTLISNPLYEQTIAKAQLNLVKEKRRLDSILYKCRRNRGVAPVELEQQREFLDM